MKRYLKNYATLRGILFGELFQIVTNTVITELDGNEDSGNCCCCCCYCWQNLSFCEVIRYLICEACRWLMLM